MFNRLLWTIWRDKGFVQAVSPRDLLSVPWLLCLWWLLSAHLLMFPSLGTPLASHLYLPMSWRFCLFYCYLISNFFLSSHVFLCIEFVRGMSNRNGGEQHHSCMRVCTLYPLLSSLFVFGFMFPVYALLYLLWYRSCPAGSYVPYSGSTCFQCSPGTYSNGATGCVSSFYINLSLHLLFLLSIIFVFFFFFFFFCLAVFFIFFDIVL